MKPNARHHFVNNHRKPTIDHEVFIEAQSQTLDCTYHMVHDDVSFVDVVNHRYVPILRVHIQACTYL